jgi:hypothetical protein
MAKAYTGPTDHEAAVVGSNRQNVVHSPSIAGQGDKPFNHLPPINNPRVSSPRTTAQPIQSDDAVGRLLTPSEAANVLRVSLSWLAKARMRGDGAPFIRIGRAIRYSEMTLSQWMNSQQRRSTSER